ncbi:MAG: hypothetical protein JEY71_08715 [Sphaerochaeta sp.]|nr:hypothetical protein [Sphaerochaeta sp.]
MFFVDLHTSQARDSTKQILPCPLAPRIKLTEVRVIFKQASSSLTIEVHQVAVDDRMAAGKDVFGYPCNGVYIVKENMSIIIIVIPSVELD